ncbi:GAF domain-containing protein [Paractinoplanes atraurantiacus]|uniref:GAF domain-containing protein n=1 Tax=Paractinoplanes atraurantiacus TaxID=1036182 RepID=A0A285EXM1_9ACTN|nr:GAF domain-containing protein [Actinoplanes atraurantiacus]SNY03759.1 GAF domain-containing protein [Actinoplanes atraurantiacus]
MEPSASLAQRRRLEVVAGIDFDDPELRRQLDRLAERTARRLDAPVSLVTLLSHITQFFVGSYGLPPWVEEVRGTPAEWSFCTEVVASGRAHTYPDLAGHPVHRTNPLVVVDGARSYAGMPLVIDDEVVGTHCVVGLAERTYTEAEMEELRGSAQEVVAVLEQHRRRPAG